MTGFDAQHQPDAGRMREFDTGATRDTNEGRLDYEGFLSPLALRRFAQYMHHHRKQADGKLRASDNWQKGMPQEVYLQSLMRHVMDVWLIQRGYKQVAEAMTVEEALCGVMFNVQGLLHERLATWHSIHTAGPPAPLAKETE